MPELPQRAPEGLYTRSFIPQPCQVAGGYPDSRGNFDLR
jgi:hypothetical protein